jgi:hypothetical protein
MGRKIVLQQPTISVSTNTYQDSRFAGRVPGGAKSGLALVHVLAVSGWTGFPMIKIYTCSDLALDPDPVAASGSFWISLGSTAAINNIGVKPIALTQMAEYIKWSVEAGSPGSSATLRFSIDVYAYEA